MTPSHHRVHHGRNPACLDRNHGGILIVWDRLFGTFEQEKERPEYGLTVPLESYNPLVIAFHEWHSIFRDVLKANTWKGRLCYIFGPPGWREDGRGKTSKILKQEALAQQNSQAPVEPPRREKKALSINQHPGNGTSLYHSHLP
jgi:hypothetical protein